MKVTLQIRRRASTLLMACLFVITGFSTNAQAKGPLDSMTVSIKVNNVKMLMVIRSIQAQTGYYFYYNKKDVDDQQKVTCSFNKTSVSEALHTLFPDFTWIFDGKGIVLRRNMTPNNQAAGIPLKTGSGGLVGDTSMYDISGTVVDDKGAPLPGATIVVKGTGRGAVTDEHGGFRLLQISKSSTLLVTSLGFEHIEMGVLAKEVLKIRLQPSIKNIEGVNVVSTGYQSIGKERATGSYDLITNQTINRSVSTDIISRLEGVASGVLFDSNNGNTLGISIRGRSTIFASTAPVVVLDNFVYDGDIKNINPNDVQSITILKDAAAASIWGVQAANGVIVITTKKGSFENKPVLSFNANTTIGQKPNFFYTPSISSSDYIDIEKYLFDQGYYDSNLSNPYSTTALTPTVYALTKNKNGEITNDQLTATLNQYRKQDVRNDIDRYLYQSAVSQQYNLNLSGGTIASKYFVSGGYDKNTSNVKGDKYERITFNGNNTYLFAKNKLELTTNLIFTQTRSTSNGLPAQGLNYGTHSTIYPYAQLADGNNRALAIDKYARPLIDTVGGGLLLDWQYRPLDEQKLQDNTLKNTDYKINIGLLYKITNYLSIDVKYQYSKGQSTAENLHGVNAFYTRDRINNFSSIDYDTKTVTRHIPLGSILDIFNSNYTGQHGRAQLNFNKEWKEHSITAIAGGEINELVTNTNSGEYYGYDPRYLSSIPVDFTSSFASPLGTVSNISGASDPDILTSRAVSLFGNMAYTFRGRYTFSLSGRKDGTNLFGVKANQKIVPFWSSGLSWDVAQDFKIKMPWLQSLKMRATYGYNGNVDKSVSALLVTFANGTNYYGLNTAAITNPPNPDLRWEKSRIINLGLDFSVLRNGTIFGSIDYYLRKGIDLIGDQLLPPSSGFPSLRGNSANMEGNGIDLIFNAQIVNSTFKWLSTVQISSSRNKVTDYKLPPGPISQYITGSISPLVGKSVTSLYSYRWDGLDPLAGDPLGVYEGKVSKDYGLILNSSNLNELGYDGPQQPPVFGNFMNAFSYRNFSLTVNLTYKFGGYFRRPSINYSNVFSGNSLGNNDYERRWQHPGDEAKTNIPSMVYPADYNRDVFYMYSNILSQKSDFVRLKDISVCYDLFTVNHRPLLKGLKVYAYLNNIALLYKANKFGIDPDFIPNNSFSSVAPFSFSIGIKVNL